MLESWMKLKKGIYMNVTSVLKKKEDPLANMVIPAEEARKLMKNDKFPENWLKFALNDINQAIMFQANSKNEHVALWNCQIKYLNAEGVWVFIPLTKEKDEDKLVMVRDILVSRGYEVVTSSNAAEAGWWLDIKW